MNRSHVYVFTLHPFVAIFLHACLQMQLFCGTGHWASQENGASYVAALIFDVVDDGLTYGRIHRSGRPNGRRSRLRICSVGE